VGLSPHPLLSEVFRRLRDGPLLQAGGHDTEHGGSLSFMVPASDVRSTRIPGSQRPAGTASKTWRIDRHQSLLRPSLVRFSDSWRENPPGTAPTGNS